VVCCLEFLVRFVSRQNEQYNLVSPSIQMSRLNVSRKVHLFLLIAQKNNYANASCAFLKLSIATK
jgi:hypothetical protein